MLMASSRPATHPTICTNPTDGDMRPIRTALLLVIDWYSALGQAAQSVRQPHLSEAI